MIRNINRDISSLSIKASECNEEDYFLISDLKDTLKLHSSRCVGMAANMIGFPKAMIIVSDNGNNIVMINPKVIRKFGKEYVTKEGCLSLVGEREVNRFEKIQVEYTSEAKKKIQRTFSGFTAQIIQHELDHLDGKII